MESKKWSDNNRRIRQLRKDIRALTKRSEESGDTRWVDRGHKFMYEEIRGLKR